MLIRLVLVSILSLFLTDCSLGYPFTSLFFFFFFFRQVYFPQLSPRGRGVRSIIQRGNEFRFDYPALQSNLDTEDSGNPLWNLLFSVTYYGTALLHKLLSPSVPPRLKMLQDQDEHVI
ncbi:hypothetical protein ABKV19_004822 [Rosa sericea]